MEEELGATINDGGQQLGGEKSDSSQMEDGGRITREREGERESEGEGDVEVAAGRSDGWWHVCWGVCVGEGEGEGEQ
jgi:hypothetical protein